MYVIKKLSSIVLPSVNVESCLSVLGGMRTNWNSVILHLDIILHFVWKLAGRTWKGSIQFEASPHVVTDPKSGSVRLKLNPCSGSKITNCEGSSQILVF
jgi:hypothetical protein